jgi:hypothetical protein
MIQCTDMEHIKFIPELFIMSQHTSIRKGKSRFIRFYHLHCYMFLNYDVSYKCGKRQYGYWIAVLNA